MSIERIDDPRQGRDSLGWDAKAPCPHSTSRGMQCRFHRLQRVVDFSYLIRAEACAFHVTPSERAAWDDMIRAIESAEELAAAIRDQGEFPACWSWPIPERTQPDDEDLLDAWQDERCAICGTNRLSLDLDHDHATGWVRGMLCRRCNNREGRSGAPVFQRYRILNPAVILGLEIVYRHPFGYDPISVRPSDPGDLLVLSEMLADCYFVD